MTTGAESFLAWENFVQEETFMQGGPYYLLLAMQVPSGTAQQWAKVLKDLHGGQFIEGQEKALLARTIDQTIDRFMEEANAWRKARCDEQGVEYAADVLTPEARRQLTNFLIYALRADLVHRVDGGRERQVAGLLKEGEDVSD